MSDTTLINDVSINGNEELTTASDLSETLQDNTINALGVDASSRTIWVNGQPYGNAYVNIKDDNSIEAPIGAEIFNDFVHNVASGEYSHAGGLNTVASGKSSFATGQNTMAISENSVAMGNNNIAGLKGWYYGSINKIDDTTIDVYVSDSQMGDPNYPTWGGTTILSTLNPYEVLHVDTVVSLINDVKYDNKFKVIDGEPGRIRLQTLSGNLPFSSITIDSELDPEDYSIYCLSMPTAGVADVSMSSIAEGRSTKALGACSHAEGYNTAASGKYSHAEGGGTTASGENSHAEGANTMASGPVSHAEGINTTAVAGASHTEGVSTIAAGWSSHAEGTNTTAAGWSSHAEGYYTEAKGDYSHAEGYYTEAKGDYSHAEGTNTTAGGANSHAEGYYTEAKGDYSHAEGTNTTAAGPMSHAEGTDTTAAGLMSHAEGINTTASGDYSHAEGVSSSKADFDAINDEEPTNIVEKIKANWLNSDKFSLAYGDSSHVEGKDNLALGSCSHAEGEWTTAEGGYSHAEGFRTTSKGVHSHAEGEGTTALGSASHAEGYQTNANGVQSHAEGYQTKANGKYSHSEGVLTTASGEETHAEGYYTEAKGYYSHAEGYHTTADNISSHAEGYCTKASVDYSHAEGYYTETTGKYSHAEGYYTKTEGQYSHAEGYYTKTTEDWQHVEGRYNYESDGIKLIGCGDITKKQNAVDIKSDGRIYIIGIGGFEGQSTDNKQDLATFLSDVSTSDTEFTIDKILTVNDNVFATAFYESSDVTKKDIVSDIDIDFDKLRQIPKVNFNWKNDSKKKNNIGTIAQEIAKVYPEVVSGEEGNMTVDYAKLSIIALAAIDRLEDRIKQLEDKLQ